MNDESLFAAVLEKPTAAERLSFLKQACDDTSQFRRVERLLAADANTLGILERPPADEMTLPTSPPAPEIALGTLIAGRYKILECLGEGGMGTVWLAEQTQPVRRKVALKLVKAGMDSKSVLARFEAERQALALMDHPCIAKVLDGGTVDRSLRERESVSRSETSTIAGRPYFVMEYVEGAPITAYCDSSRLNITQRLGLFMQVCQAVQHAHSKGILHRDLKPNNILVGSSDGQAVPKVIDFGLAKALHQPLTEHTLHTAHGMMMGTPRYMSPEQAESNNADVDTRADIYALGVILYELLTGTTPIERGRLDQAAWPEMMQIIAAEEPPSPSTRLIGSGALSELAAQRQLEPARLTKVVRGELDWIVMKCLEKDRARRYVTANALARDIQRYLADEPVEASPPSKAYRLQKFFRRHRGPVLAAALIFLLLVGGIVGTTIGLVRESEARRREGERADAEARERIRAETAEQAAKGNATQAAMERDRALAVREFLQKRLLSQADLRRQADDLLRSGSSPAKLKKDPTVRELLDRAAAELSPENKSQPFAEQPLVQAEILRTIGETYLSLGDHEKAIAHLGRAYEQFTRSPDPNPADAPATLNSLAFAHRLAARPQEAIRLLEQARDLCEQRFGPEHLETLSTLNNLAIAYRHAGRLREAIGLLERVRSGHEKQLGKQDPNTLATLSNLALAYQADGKLSEALSLLHQVYDANEKNLGLEHPTTLKTLLNLGTTHQASGNLPEAIRTYERVRGAWEKLDPDHQDLLLTLNALAAAYWSTRQLDHSVPLFEQVKKKMTAQLGADHPDTLVVMANLAINYRDAGQLPKAVPLMEDALKRVRSLPTPMPLSVAWIPREMAITYESNKEYAKAEPLYREFLEQARQRHGSDHLHVVWGIGQVGTILLKQSKYAEAEPFFREYLSIRRGASPRTWEDAYMTSMLGGALLGQRKFADAETLLQQSVEEMKQRSDTSSPHVKEMKMRQAMEWLVVLYDAIKKPEEAAKWRKALEAANPAGDRPGK